MKVLDINPTCCWSFHGRDQKTIDLLRQAVAIEDPQLREQTLRSIPNGKAFGFIGDVTRLDFSARFFDQVNVNFTPDFSQRGQLSQCVRRWSKSANTFDAHDQAEEPRWSSFLNRLLGTPSPSAAT
jgi:hypothetical protein